MYVHTHVVFIFDIPLNECMFNIYIVIYAG